LDGDKRLFFRVVRTGVFLNAKKINNMKKIFFATVIGVCSWGAVSAQRVQNPNEQGGQVQTDEKIKISVEELPDAIKNVLENDSYKGWSVEAAQYNKTKDLYEVEVRKGTESKIIKFTKDGSIVE
jgi:hypothetical protein